MKNDLPTKYKENLFSKISNFFKKIFNKPKVEKIEIKEINEEINEANTFKNEIKVGTQDNCSYIQNMNKEKFVEQFEKNPDLLQNLSTEQLEKMDKYYDVIIEEYKQKLKKLA